MAEKFEITNNIRKLRFFARASLFIMQNGDFECGLMNVDHVESSIVSIFYRNKNIFMI